MTDTLFPLPDAHEDPVGAVKVPPRVQRPNRTQLEWRPVDLEARLPADHGARVVWEFVEGLDLSPLYHPIKALEGHAGRTPIDPAILMALWLYGTLEGVGSARALARLCEEHDAYRGLCGGVSVNYHTLADFRVAHPEVLDGLLTVEQLQRRYGRAPGDVLADGGYVDLEDIRAVAGPAGGCKVYAPPPGFSEPGRAQRPLGRVDDAIVAEWRQRMGTAEAKGVYGERAATVECVNALARNRGLRQFVIRGLRKVRAVLLWFALAHNLMRAAGLRRAGALAT
jgi:transposase